MTPAQILQILRARKLATLAVIVLAVAAALVTERVVGPPPSGAATVQIAIDARASILTDLRQDAAPLITRAAVFAQVMSSRLILAEIAHRAGLAADQITAQGPYTGTAEILDTITPAEARSNQLLTERTPYRLSFVPEPDQPVVTTLVQAPTPAGAARLAAAVLPAASAYVSEVQHQTPSIVNPLRLRQEGPVQVGAAGESRLPVLGAAAGAVLIAGLLAIMLLDGLLRRRPIAACEAEPGRRRRQASILALLVVSVLAAVLTGYRPSLSPLGLHARGVALGAAQAEVLIDTRDSAIADVQQVTADNAYLGGQLALNYLLYLQSQAVTAQIGQALGLRGQSVAAGGPFTLLIGRTNYAHKQVVLAAPQHINHAYRLLIDLDGTRPVITLYAQAPTPGAAAAIVDTARALLAREVARQETNHVLPDFAAVVLRPLGVTTAGVIAGSAHWQLMLTVFVLVLVTGAVLLRAAAVSRRHLAAPSDSEPAPPLRSAPRGADDWPHTRRVMPWMLAGFVAMLFLVPFDAIQLPFHLPVNSTLDRPIIVLLVVVWLIAMRSPRRSIRPRVALTSVHYALLVFVVLCLASLAINGNVLLNLGEGTLVVKKLALLGSYVVFFLVVASVLRPGEVPRFALFMVVLAVIVAVGTIAEYRTHYNVFYGVLGRFIPLTEPNLLDMPDSIGRLTVYGPTLQPLELAAMLAMILPFALLGAMDSQGRRRVLYLAAVALLIAGGFATGRKTALVLPLVIVLILVAFRPRAMRALLPLVLVLAIGIHFASPAALGSVISELEPGHVNTALTTTDRTARYDAVIPDVLSRPAIGRGYESYDPQKYRILDNQYLDLLITVGLLGTVAYISVFATAMGLAKRTIRSRDPVRARLALAAFASVAAIAVASALFDTLSFPHVPYLLLFVAAMITTLRQSDRQSVKLTFPSTFHSYTMDHRLLVITPVHNEAKHVSAMVKGMVAQSRRPDRWVIVDDASTDDTLTRLRALTAEFDFVSVIALPPRGQNGDGLATANEVHAFLSGLDSQDADAFTHVAKLDGDVELPREWYARLLERFAADPELGIAGGDLVEITHGARQVVPIPRHHVHGAVKMYGAECFAAIGGMQERLGWDSVDEAYARMRGWTTRSYSDLVAIHHRPLASAQGVLRGRARHGLCAYIVHQNPAWVLLRAVKVGRVRPVVVGGIAFLYGYVRGAVRREPRVADPALREFVRHELRGRALAAARVRRVR